MNFGEFDQFVVLKGRQKTGLSGDGQTDRLATRSPYRGDEIAWEKGKGKG